MLAQIQALVRQGDVRISDHGYDELAEDEIGIREVVAGVHGGVVVEDYPAYPKGHCILVRQDDRSGRSIHVVWGIPKGAASPAVVVTAYRPDPRLWSIDFLRRTK